MRSISSAPWDGLQSLEIDRDVTEVEQPDAGTRATQDRVHTREQFFEVERFGDVVVGAEFQPAKLVALLSLGREKDDGGSEILAPPLDQLEAAFARQVHVEEHEIGSKRFGRARRRIPIRDALHLKTFERQIVVEDPRQHRIVLDDEHALFHTFKSG